MSSPVQREVLGCIACQCLDGGSVYGAKITACRGRSSSVAYHIIPRLVEAGILAWESEAIPGARKHGHCHYLTGTFLAEALREELQVLEHCGLDRCTD